MRKDAHKRYALYASFYYKISKAKLVFEGGLRRSYAGNGHAER